MKKKFLKIFWKIQTMTDSVRMEPTSYDYVTKDVCKKWSSDGKSDILGQFVDLQKNQGKGEIGKNSPLLKARTIVHELIWRCLGQLRVQSILLPCDALKSPTISPSNINLWTHWTVHFNGRHFSVAIPSSWTISRSSISFHWCNISCRCWMLIGGKWWSQSTLGKSYRIRFGVIIGLSRLRARVRAHRTDKNNRNKFKKWALDEVFKSEWTWKLVHWKKLESFKIKNSFNNVIFEQKLDYFINNKNSIYCEKKLKVIPN